MRLNVDDRALRDPNINRRLPRFTGLNRFDAIGRLLHVWGLCYDARSPFALIEDVDDRAEHEGFARAMVQAGCADAVDDLTIRVRGVEERIGYLTANSEGGQRGGETRAKQAAQGGRGKGGRFTTVNTTPTVVASTVSASADVESDHTSGSGSSPAPDQITVAAASPPVLFAPESPIPKPDPAADLARHATAEINRATGRNFDPASKATLKLARALVREKVTAADVTRVVEHKAAEWLGTSIAARVCPATLLAADNFAKYLDEARAGPPTRAGPPANGSARPLPPEPRRLTDEDLRR